MWVQDLHIHRKMDETGLAWVYRQYLKDQSLLVLEQEARKAKRGSGACPVLNRYHPGNGERVKDQGMGVAETVIRSIAAAQKPGAAR